MLPLRTEEGLNGPSKIIRVRTARQADGQGRASGKTAARSGRLRTGGGGRSFKGAKGGRIARLPWGAGVYPEATAEPQKDC